MAFKFPVIKGRRVQNPEKPREIITAPLTPEPYPDRKIRKTPEYNDARSLTRKLNLSETEKNDDLSLAFESSVLKLFEKYPKTENLSEYEKAVLDERVSAGLKYFVELLAIRKYDLEKVKPLILSFGKFYKLPTSKVSQIEGVLDAVIENKRNLNELEKAFSSKHEEVFKEIIGADITSYPGVKIVLGPIGYEVSGDLDQINKIHNKLNNKNKSVGGFAMYRPFLINGKTVDIHFNFFVNGKASTYIHELQHNLNKIISKNRFDASFEETSKTLKNLAKNPQQHSEILDAHYKNRRKEIMRMLGDEILAQLRGGTSFEELVRHFKKDFLIKNKSIYDYLAKVDEIDTPLRGGKEEYFYSPTEDKVVTVTEISEEEIKKLGLIRVRANPLLKEMKRTELILKFNRDTSKILKSIGTIIKSKILSDKELVGILSLHPIENWPKLLDEIYRLKLRPSL